jgi:Ser/Thr protein kinase RdoA (MazF antagonist)
VVEACGGPETLLHGDLWTINVLVRPARSGLEARLIDWDHAGVGPVSYDLSAYLLRFPEPERAGILSHYEERSPSRRRWPSRAEWNALFDTAERARLANSLLWRALGVLDGHDEWTFGGLAWHEEAFDSLGPLLPDGPPRRGVADDPAPGSGRFSPPAGGRACDT